MDIDILELLKRASLDAKYCRRVSSTTLVPEKFLLHTQCIWVMSPFVWMVMYHPVGSYGTSLFSGGHHHMYTSQCFDYWLGLGLMRSD